MKIVIQCAGSKNPNAKTMKTTAGKLVKFVAQPNEVSDNAECQYARPDDSAGGGATWRDLLCAYNEKYQQSRHNPFNLLPAFQLYARECYAKLVDKFGIENVYIHSAGWGLIPAGFLTPDYDITFSKRVPKKDAYKIRKKEDYYRDFDAMPVKAGERVFFFGGNDYLKKYCELSKDCAGERVCFYKKKCKPDIEDVTLIKYETTTRTNWHYECANEFIAGKLPSS